MDERSCKHRRKDAKVTLDIAQPSEYSLLDPCLQSLYSFFNLVYVSSQEFQNLKQRVFRVLHAPAPRFPRMWHMRLYQDIALITNNIRSSWRYVDQSFISIPAATFQGRCGTNWLVHRDTHDAVMLKPSKSHTGPNQRGRLQWSLLTVGEQGRNGGPFVHGFPTQVRRLSFCT